MTQLLTRQLIPSSAADHSVPKIKEDTPQAVYYQNTTINLTTLLHHKHIYFKLSLEVLRSPVHGDNRVRAKGSIGSRFGGSGVNAIP